MVKKFLKIITINIFLIIFLFIGFEIYFYKKDTDFLKKNFLSNQSYHSFKKEPFENKFKYFYKEVMRKPVGLNYKKKPILFLGCSYAYGEHLNDEETISYKVSEKTKRPVYNWSCMAGGIQHVYYVIDKMPKITPEPEYIFYLYFSDHLRRMYTNVYKVDCYENLQYRLKDGKLEKKDNRYNIFDNSYFLSNIKDYILLNYYKNTKNSHNLFIVYATHLKNRIKELYPKTKFIIVVYDEMPYRLFQELKNNGIEVIYIYKCTDINLEDEKYKLPKEKDFNQHPNGLTWDVVSDIIVNEYNL